MSAAVAPPPSLSTAAAGAGAGGGAGAGPKPGTQSIAGTAVETQHEDMIHDAQLDYYGKRLATCSSDRTIRIFSVVDGQARGEPVVLKGHSGPVWQIAWAHPSFGPILASCSYDGRVYVWKEVPQAAQGGRAGGGVGMGGSAGPRDGPGEWEKIKEHGAHGASVNSICWAPHELGPILACASSDGKVSVLTFNNDGSTTCEMFPAHAIGANCVSWSPATAPGSLTTAGLPGQVGAQGQGLQHWKKFATGGCDGVVRIWSYAENQDPNWVKEEDLTGHTDWVRDVAWAPNIGMPGTHIATCSQDRTVLIHYRPSPNAPWQTTPLYPGGPDNSDPHFPDAVWKLSWSLAGNILAVSCGDGKVTLWKEVVGGKGWECVSEMNS